ncbi:hypothetical protein B566_EDAN010949 [Ephemera danica]|nr:hypothetical protein B566_EDAN010949 [Ephemera danica]
MKKAPFGMPQRYRPFLDYINLNRVSKVDTNPHRLITETLSSLGGCGYRQIKIHQDSIPYTAFSTPEGHYECLWLAFGLSGVPATFTNVITILLTGLMGDICIFYLDYVIWFELLLLRSANLRLKPNKLTYYANKYNTLVILGRVSPGVVKVKAIREYPWPTEITEVRIKNNCAFDFNQKGGTILFGPQFSFIMLMRALCEETVLRNLRFDLPFRLTTDGSSVALAAVLSQTDDTGDDPIAYNSYQLREIEK